MKAFMRDVKWLSDALRYCLALWCWDKVGKFMCPLEEPCKGDQCKCYLNGKCGHLATFDELRDVGSKKLGINDIHSDANSV